MSAPTADATPSATEPTDDQVRAALHAWRGKPHVLAPADVADMRAALLAPDVDAALCIFIPRPSGRPDDAWHAGVRLRMAAARAAGGAA